MTPGEVTVWREHYMLTRGQMADLLGVHATSVLRWENGDAPVPRWLPLALETLGGRREKIAAKLRLLPPKPLRGFALKKARARRKEMSR